MNLHVRILLICIIIMVGGLGIREKIIFIFFIEIWMYTKEKYNVVYMHNFLIKSSSIEIIISV